MENNYELQITNYELRLGNGLLKRITCLLSILISSATIVLGQNASQDFEKINAAYKSIRQLSMDMEYRVFKNETTTTPLQIEKGTIKKSDNLLYQKIGEIEKIKALNYDLIVDHEDKVISLLGADRKKASNNNILAIDIGKLLSLCEKVEFQQVNSTFNAYILSASVSEYKKIRIVFNKKNYLIEKLDLFYRDADNLDNNEAGIKEIPRLEIIYKNINTKPEIAPSNFSYEHFIEKNKDSYSCKEKYKDYKLIEQMEVFAKH